MAPRAYALGRRAATASATRQHVLDAAATLYGERGVSGTSLHAVATRADVSRGTIAHHFGGAEGLLEAVLDWALESVAVPDEHSLDGISDPSDRLRRYVEVMYAFHDRSHGWFEVFRDDLARPAVAARERSFWETTGRLHAAALGDLAGDRVVASTIAALLHPVTFSALREAGLSVTEATRAVGDLLVTFVGPGP